MKSKFDVLDDLCRKKYGVDYPQFMAHNAVYGIRNMREFDHFIEEAMDIYSKQNVEAKEKSYLAFIDELNKVFESEKQKNII